MSRATNDGSRMCQHWQRSANCTGHFWCAAIIDIIIPADNYNQTILIICQHYAHGTLYYNIQCSSDVNIIILIYLFIY
jgi:hypothetical protein